MHTALARLETNRACSPHTNTTPIDRGWPHLDVGPHVERPLEMPQIHAARPTDARRALIESGVCEFLGHGASQATPGIHPGAKNTPPSKLPVTGHDLRSLEQSRACA